MTLNVNVNIYKDGIIENRFFNIISESDDVNIIKTAIKERLKIDSKYEFKLDGISFDKNTKRDVKYWIELNKKY